jgi:tetratricopeptide (TPR) repeat protein
MRLIELSHVLDPDRVEAMRILLGAISALVMILVPIIGFIHQRNAKIRKYYEVMRKRSSSINPREILHMRAESRHGFLPYYHQRAHDRIIRQRIAAHQNVLVIGKPLAGKSRAILEGLKTLDKPYDVTIPRVGHINPEDFGVPRRFTFWRGRILVLDDLNEFVGKENFLYLLEEFLNRQSIIVASCRSGTEYRATFSAMGPELSDVFGDPIEITDVSVEEAKRIAGKTDVSLPPTFDGSIGSLFLGLDAMRERFLVCDDIQKAVLVSMRRLYYAGMCQERAVFSLKTIKRASSSLWEIEKKSYEWDVILSELQDKGFIQVRGDGVLAEEVYLEFVVEDALSVLDNLAKMLDVFTNDPEALFCIGAQAAGIGQVDSQRSKYLDISVKACDLALRIYTRECSPEQYARCQNILGIAYGLLAQVRDKAENCRKGIAAFQEALRVNTLERSPMNYAFIQDNMGNALASLAEVEDKVENCKRAIEAHQQALKVFTLERFPRYYASVQDNLGATYSKLAEVQDKTENCRRAIEAHQEALKIFTLELSPMAFACAQNNLGVACGKFATVSGKAENCKKAIRAIQEALRVFTLERFPLHYGVIMNTLGCAYITLADVEDNGTCQRF